MSPLKLGDTAPFDGQLLSTEAAISNTLRLEDFQAKLDLAVQNQKDLTAVEIDGNNKIHAIDIKSKDEQIEIYKTALDKRDSFWHSWEFGALVGATAMLVVVWVVRGTATDSSHP